MNFKDLSRIDALLTELLTMKAAESTGVYSWVTSNYSRLYEANIAVNKALSVGVEITSAGIAESLELVSNA